MRHFSHVELVRLPLALEKKAAKFARQVLPTVDYRHANQKNSEKIEIDHRVSKLGEEAVRIIYQQYGCQVTGPDYQIYQARQKSWASDLHVDGVPLAVKTQTGDSAQQFGISWMFAEGDTRRDPILDQPDAWVCFVVVSSLTAWVYPAFQIKDLQYGQPKLEHLKGKKTVYARNLDPARLGMTDGALSVV